MEIDDCRKAFEKWNAAEEHRNLRIHNGEYLDQPVRHSWNGWQAAWKPERESIALIEKDRREALEIMKLELTDSEVRVRKSLRRPTEAFRHPEAGMKIVRNYLPSTMEHQIVITVTDHFIMDECHPHPFAHVITEEQGVGIVEDSILMAMHLERNAAKKTDIESEGR